MALLTSAAAWRGSGVVLAEIARGLAERGHRPHLLAGADDVVAGFAALCLPVRQVPVENTGLVEAMALRRALGALDADLLLVDRPRDLRLGFLAVIGRRTRLVNRYDLSRTHPPRDLISRLAYRRVRLSIFPSETLGQRVLPRAAYLRCAPHRIIAGGVDPERFRPDPEGAAAFRREHALGETRFVLAVGALSAEKGYDLLFDAIARLPRTVPLVVCGDGPLAAQLRARAADLRLTVRFLGQVPPERLPGAYTAAACVAHACGIETFGMSVLEAMACGAAVVTVDGGGAAEVVGDAGMRVPLDDPEALAAAIGQVLANDERRRALGAAARQRAVTRFGLARMRQAYVDAIESVVAGG